MNDKNIMIAVSGGRSSAMMARHIQTSQKYRNHNKFYVFANTGQERMETFDFLKNMVKVWGIPLNMVEAVGSSVMGVGIGYKEVDFDSVSMNSEPFESVIKHKNKGVFDGLPNSASPYCSGDLKTIPCKKICDAVFGVNNYVKAIGYRLEDMPKRITWSEVEADKRRIFPLLTDWDFPVGLRRLDAFWNKQPFKLGINSRFGNCELCWKKSNKNIVDNIRFGSRSVEWWRRMETQYGNTAFRERKSIDDFVKLAKEPYTPEIDFGNSDDEDGCACNF